MALIRDVNPIGQPVVVSVVWVRCSCIWDITAWNNVRTGRAGVRKITNVALTSAVPGSRERSKLYGASPSYSRERTDDVIARAMLSLGSSHFNDAIIYYSTTHRRIVEKPNNHFLRLVWETAESRNRPKTIAFGTCHEACAVVQTQLLSLVN